MKKKKKTTPSARDIQICKAPGEGEDRVVFPVNQNETKEEKTGQKTGRGNRRSTLPNTLPGQADTIQKEIPLGTSTYDPPVSYTAPQKRLTFC